MGMKEEMHNLCEDILESQQNRIEAVKEIQDGTEQMLNNFNFDRKAMSKELAEELNEYNDGIKNDTEKMLNNFNADRRMKSKELAEELNEISPMLDDFKNARADMSKEQAEDLKEFNVWLRNSVTDLREGFAEERKELRGDIGDLFSEYKVARRETIRDLEGMHEEWQKMATKSIAVTPRAQAKVKHGIKKEEGRAELEKDMLKKKVLEIINATPDGLSLANIGSKIGIEWRKLTRPVKELLNEGKVQKEGTNYFPIIEIKEPIVMEVSGQ